MGRPLVEVKSELCEKYRRLANLSKSTPRRKNLLKKSQRYAKQVIKLAGPK